MAAETIRIIGIPPEDNPYARQPSPQTVPAAISNWGMTTRRAVIDKGSTK